MHSVEFGFRTHLWFALWKPLTGFAVVFLDSQNVTHTCNTKETY